MSGRPPQRVLGPRPGTCPVERGTHARLTEVGRASATLDGASSTDLALRARVATDRRMSDDWRCAGLQSAGVTTLDRAYALAASQFGLASRSQLLAAGLTAGALDHRVRVREWTVPLAGVYDLHAPLRDDGLPWEALLMSAQLAHPGECAAVLATAGRLRGLPYCSDGGIDVRVPPGLEQVQRPGIRFHTWKVWPRDIVRDGPFLVTVPVRTVADLLLRRGRDQGVAILDAALHLGLITLEDLTTVAAIMGGRRGCRRARTYLPLTAIGAQSPLETKVRLIAVDAGHPPDGLQVPLLDDAGRVIGYGDLGWKTRDGWLIAECDGIGPHSLPNALAHDRRRQNELLLQPGVTIVRFTWPDTESPAYVVSVIRRALTH